MPALILPARTVAAATPRTRIITLDLNGHDFPFRAGQAVSVGLAHSPVRRFYSIACSPGQARRAHALELLVQIDDPSAPDPHLERVVPGTPLSVEGPFGSFELPSPLPESHMLLVAGGTGIAPLRSMMWDVLEGGTPVATTLIYSARGREEFAYIDELRRLADDGRIALVLTATREAGPEWTGARGRISRALIASVLASVETRCLICGPASLVTDATALLREAGVAAERILTETYAA